jgi:hypothetical protein
VHRRQYPAHSVTMSAVAKKGPGAVVGMALAPSVLGRFGAAKAGSSVAAWKKIRGGSEW